jgi:hypothetical protein
MCKLSQTTSEKLRARVKYIHGSQLAPERHSNVNKQNYLCLTENNFPNLQPPSSSFNWRNRSKINPTTPNPREIDQACQHPTETTETHFLGV